MEWIRFADRIPGVGQHVITYDEARGAYGWGVPVTRECGYDRQNTHWMPLPEPPERKEQLFQVFDIGAFKVLIRETVYELREEEMANFGDLGEK